MIQYTVVWLKSARDELADIWLGASDRDAITAATYAIDRRLATDSLAKGELLSEGLRALTVPPFRVLFSVSERDRLVEVVVVRTI